MIVAVGLLPMWLIVFPVLAVAGSIVLYAWLGATQTNRRKAWVRHTQLGLDGHPVGSRFERDPELAARFGIYSMVIWLTAIAVAVVLYFTVGWVWIPLAFVGAFVVMMITLARMLFSPQRGETAAGAGRSAK